MTDFTYYNPVRIVFGQNKIKELSLYLKQRKALLITSRGFTERGVVKELLSEHPLIKRVYDQVPPNPTLQSVENFYSEMDLDGIEVIVALGGGSVIDFAKAVSFSKDDEYSYSLFKRVLLGHEDDSTLNYVPIVAIPTTAGTSSEITPWGTIWDDINKMKYSIHTDFLMAFSIVSCFRWAAPYLTE